MEKFQSYYRYAIWKHANLGSSIEELRKSIMTVLSRYISSDANPKHAHRHTDSENIIKLALGWSKLCLHNQCQRYQCMQAI